MLARALTISVAVLLVGAADGYATAAGVGVRSIRVAEPSEGSSRAFFVVSLPRPARRPVTVRYTVSAGPGGVSDPFSALADRDFSARRSGTLRFEPGQRRRRIPIRVLADAIDEDEQRLSVTIRRGGATATAKGTIVDGDRPPTLTIDDTQVAEGDGHARVQLRLSAPTERRAHVVYATRMLSASGADLTYVSGRLSVTPGSRAPMTILVPLRPDTDPEAAETFAVDLKHPAGLVLARTSGLVTIADDDPPVAVAVESRPVQEHAGDQMLRMRLGRRLATQASVRWEAIPGTAGADDFEPTSGTAVFRAGTTSQSIPVRVKPDSLDEDDETIAVRIVEARGLSAGPDGIATVADDDPTPELLVGRTVADEWTGGTFLHQVPVALSAVSGRTVTARYAMADYSAEVGADYGPVSGTISFAPGEQHKSVAVPIHDDPLGEFAESTYLDLTDLVNATFASPGGALIITSGDDGPPCPTMDDSFEPNDTPAEAVPVTVDSALPRLASCGGDPDYFRINVPPGATLAVIAAPDAGHSVGAVLQDTQHVHLAADSSPDHGEPAVLGWTNSSADVVPVLLSTDGHGTQGYYELFFGLS